MSVFGELGDKSDPLATRLLRRKIMGLRYQLKRVWCWSLVRYQQFLRRKFKKKNFTRKFKLDLKNAGCFVAFFLTWDFQITSVVLSVSKSLWAIYLLDLFLNNHKVKLRTQASCECQHMQSMCFKLQLLGHLKQIFLLICWLENKI